MQKDDLLIQYKERVSQSFRDEKYEQCLVFTEKMLKLDKNNFNALCYKATCLEKLGSYKKAIKIIDHCLETNDDLFHLWVTRGDCHYGLEEWRKAFNDYFTALPLDEENGAVMDKCARCLFRLGDANYALHFIQQAINTSESPEPVLVMIAMLNSLGLTDYAQQVVRVGVKTFPDDDRFFVI
jgi:tetratricopeptide (TPR) repeat protein